MNFQKTDNFLTSHPLRKAVIFDLDGTLIPTTSAERIFFYHLIRHGGLSPLNLLQMGRELFKVHGNFHELTRGNKQYLRGKSVQKIKNIAEEYFEPRIDTLLFPVMRAILEAHRVAGDMILLLTGTLDFIAACFVDKLKLDGYKASTLEIVDGKYTGKLSGIQPYGIGKLEVLRDLRRQFHFDQNNSILYANIYSDRYVLNAVEEPIAVNPDKLLRRYAQKSKWRIIDV
jgi:HAD superfamily hydrolase (TIGR01490 family)